MPSLLACDFTNIAAGLRKVRESGCKWLHMDVMDGHFVPEISFGTQMIASVRSCCDLVLDIHLMTFNPAEGVDSMYRAGADRLTFHIEAETHAHRIATEIKNKGMACGIAIVPSTPLCQIEELFEHIDQIVIMTVNPGWGGQNLISSTLDKVERLSNIKSRGNYDFSIIIDGGFSKSTAKSVWAAGTEIAVMGSAFFSAEDSKRIINDCLGAC